jgi:cell division septation protein DedD
VKTGQNLSPGLSDLAKRSQEANRLDDLNKANALIAKEVNFFDSRRIRSLGGQLAEKAAEAAVRRLTPAPPAAVAPQGVSSMALKVAAGPSVASSGLAATPALAPPFPAAKTLKDANKNEPSWLSSVKWLTRLFLSFVFLVWIFILGVLVGRGSLWEYPNGSFLNPAKPNSPAKMTVETANWEEPAQTPKAPSPAKTTDPPPKAGPSVASSASSASGASSVASNASVALNAFAPSDPSFEAGPKAGPDEDLNPQVTSREDPPASSPLENDESHLSEGDNLSEESMAGSFAKDPEIARLSKFAPTEGSSPLIQAKPLTNPPKEIPKTPKAAPAPLAPSREADSYWPAKPKGSGGFTIQVGSGKTATEAKKIVEHFQALNFSAYYYEKNSRNFPVRVGRYQSQAEAEADKAKLAKAGAFQPYVSKLIY